MRVLIVGAGQLGSKLAEALIERQSNEVTVIESDEARAESAAERLDAMVLYGDGTHPDILHKARLDDAHALVAATGSDAINTVIAMLGKRYDVPKLLVRLKGTELRAACDEIGVTQVVTPKVTAVAAMVRSLYGLNQLDLSTLEQSKLQLLQLPASHRAGKEISQLGLPNGTLAVAIARDNEILLAHGSDSLDEQDELLVLTDSERARRGARAALGLGEENH